MAGRNQNALVEKMADMIVKGQQNNGGGETAALLRALLGRDSLPLQASNSMALGRALRNYGIPLLQQAFDSWKSRYDARGQFKANYNEIAELLKAGKTLSPHQLKTYEQVKKYYPERVKDLPAPVNYSQQGVTAPASQTNTPPIAQNPEPQNKSGLLGDVQPNPGLDAAIANSVQMPQLPSADSLLGKVTPDEQPPISGEALGEYMRNQIASSMQEDKLRQLLGNWLPTRGAF